MGLSDVVYVADSWPDMGLGVEMLEFPDAGVANEGEMVETGNLEHPGEKCFPEQKLSVDFGEVLVCCGENPSWTLLPGGI